MSRTLAWSAALLLALCACSSQQAQSPPAAAASQTSQAGTGNAGSQIASGSASAGSASGGATASASSGTTGGVASPAVPQGPLALPTSSQWKPGVNYDVISPAQPTNAPPGKVQVMEVFWLACPHCHALEPYLLAWRKSKPDYVQFVRVPVMWGPVQQAHARLFYTLEALNRDDLVETAFNTIHNLETQTGSESIMVGASAADTMKMQEAFATQNGIGASAFESAYNSFDVNTQLQQAEQITQTYEVESVPTVIIDGRYRTDPAKAGGESQLIALIDFLAKWDHEHQG